MVSYEPGLTVVLGPQKKIVYHLQLPTQSKDNSQSHFYHEQLFYLGSQMLLWELGCFANLCKLYKTRSKGLKDCS